MVCEVCEYKVSQKSQLQQHIKSIHDGVKYRCKYCDYEASWRDNLQLHVKSIHDGVNLAGKDPTELEVETLNAMYAMSL